MAAAVSEPELARARELAAAHLEAAIGELGVAYHAYMRTTRELSDRVRDDLAPRLELPIILHLTKAGLAPFLERKLAGQVPSLQELVAEQHR